MHPHVIGPQEDTSFTLIQEVDPLASPHVLDQRQDASFALIQEVDPLGQPHLYEPPHDLSGFQQTSEQIALAVQNVIAGIPNNDPLMNSISCAV